MRVPRVPTVGAVALGVVTSLFAVAPAASAQAAPNNCPNNAICLYEDQDFEGGILELSTVNLPVHDLSAFRFSNGHPVNDKTSSVANKTKIPIGFFRDAGCKGNEFPLPGGEFFSFLGGQNDSFTAIKQTDKAIGDVC